MGFFSKKENTIEDLVQDALIETSPVLGMEKITVKQAKKITALSSCVNLIANSVAALPIYLYKREGRERVKVDDDRNYLLNARSNNTTTAFNLKSSIIRNFLYYGNAYIYIRRDRRMNIISLDVIDNDTMEVKSTTYEDGTVEYKYNFELNGAKIVAEEYEVINIIRNPKDAFTGESVIEENARILNVAKIQEEYAYTNLSGINTRMFLSTESKLSLSAKEHLKASFRKMFSGSSSNMNIPVLEEGLTLNTVNSGFSPTDMALMEGMNYTNMQIANALQVPLSFIGQGSSTYGNTQEDTIKFLTICLNQYLRIIEEALNTYLLKENEKSDYFFEFKSSEMLKLSQEQMINYLTNATNNSLMTVAEARRELNLEYLEGTDMLILSNLGVLQDGKIINVNIGKEITEE